MRLPWTARPDDRAAEGSGLDRIIAPEIRGDAFHRAIRAVAATPGLRHLLEIGSSSGEGSTAAFVAGILLNPDRPTLHCLEVSRPRFEALDARYRHLPFVRCHNLSSVPLERFPSEAEVARFHRTVPSRLRRVRLEKVLEWLRQDVRYLAEHGLSGDGIRQVRERHGIEAFDAVLIDGSEFTGEAEMEEVYGARFLMLDDTRTFKNHRNHERLSRDPRYRRIAGSRWLRNGYAVFERVD